MSEDVYKRQSGHSVQKWKGNDMESMRDTKRIMEREIKKGSTPLTFEQMEIDTLRGRLRPV